MSTISEWDIQSAFRAKLVTLNNIPPPDQRAWENKNFSPTQDTPWIRETLLHGNENVVANNQTQQVGIMQYDLFWPAGDGVREAKQMANGIKDAFKPTTVLNNTVRIRNANVRPNNNSNNSAWYQLIIELSYTTFGTLN